MRVDRAELPPGGNRALELTEKGQAPVVSTACSQAEPGSEQTISSSRYHTLVQPSIHPFIYSIAISRTPATYARL